MMIDLKVVLEWNPEMASAYDLLAVARNAGGTTTAALDAQRAAIRLSPRNESYSFHLAQIYVTSKKWEAADALLERLKASDDPQISARGSRPANASRDAAQIRHRRQYCRRPLSRSSRRRNRRSMCWNRMPPSAQRLTNSPSGTTADKRVTKFVKGRLIAVDCSQAPSAVLTVSSEAGTLKLRAADYKSLLLIGADDFSCGWRDQVVANYKPSSGNGGDLVSLEMR